ncbi:MAG: hypothetical protein CMC55_06780 [Flavobacteriaceae bacterium]|nr:hypothetical protein [Flavobacteriaceae bacterium]
MIVYTSSVLKTLMSIMAFTRRGRFCTNRVAALSERYPSYISDNTAVIFNINDFTITSLVKEYTTDSDLANVVFNITAFDIKSIRKDLNAETENSSVTYAINDFIITEVIQSHEFTEEAAISYTIKDFIVATKAVTQNADTENVSVDVSITDFYIGVPI